MHSHQIATGDSCHLEKDTHNIVNKVCRGSKLLVVLKVTADCENSRKNRSE